MSGRRGVSAARRHLDLVDPASESPRETRLRLLLLGAGLARPVAQYEVRFPDGRFIARLDLAWPQWRVGAESDGAHHREAAQHSRDLARRNRLRAAGWVVVQVDARSLARPEDLPAQFRALIGQRTRRA